MKQILLVFLLFLLFTSGHTQNIPQVPSRLEFGGMKLIINDAARKEIQKDVDMLRASDKFFRIKLDRARLYFPIIEETFRDEGVPEDFKYLSLQESGLISDVVSSSKAVGFWQFKDFTGREVGLRIDHRIDERKNIVAASRGAAKYLKRNNFLYDNWVYALTAYYAGPGGAARYVNKKDFGSNRMEITKKTHWYVKRFLAHKIAFEQELRGDHSEGLSLVTYTKGKGKDLDRIAKELDVESDLLKHYNKWIKYGKIPDDKEYAVIIPVQGKIKRDVLAKTKKPSEKSIAEPEQKTYPKEIKPGITEDNAIPIHINGVEAIMAGKMDNLNSLSAEAGISPEEFLKYNDMLTGKSIKPGQVYYVEKKRNRSSLAFHIVRENETLWSISQRYGIKLSRLARKNRIDENDPLKVGRVLWMKSKRPKNVPVEYHKMEPVQMLVTKKSNGQNTSAIPQQPVKSDIKVEENNLSVQEPENKVPVERITFMGKKHEVAPGETLWSISRQYNISIDELMAWNELTKYDTLRVKQELFIEEPREEVVQTAKKDTTIYIVKPGDTLYSIAKSHGMGVTELMDLNGKSDSSLSVGEELKVFK